MDPQEKDGIEGSHSSSAQLIYVKPVIRVSFQKCETKISRARRYLRRVTCTFCFYLLPRRPLPFSFCTTACSNLAPVNCTSRGKVRPVLANESQFRVQHGIEVCTQRVRSALDCHRRQRSSFLNRKWRGLPLARSRYPAAWNLDKTSNCCIG